MNKKILIAMLLLTLASCGEKKHIDVGIAPPAKIPELPSSMKVKVEKLPDITDPTLGGIHKDGADTDSKYNILGYKYNALVDAWECVRVSLNDRNGENIKECVEKIEVPE